MLCGGREQLISCFILQCILLTQDAYVDTLMAPLESPVLVTTYFAPRV